MNHNRTRFKFHWLKGIEMDIPTSRALVHYIGATLLLSALAMLLHVIRWW